MNSLTTNQAIAAGGVVGGMLATFGIAALAMSVLLIIANWKIFTKAGEKGWKALIPVYNIYIAYKIVGMQNYFWITLILTFVVTFLSTLLGGNFTVTEGSFKFEGNGIAAVLVLAETIFSVVVAIMYALRLSKAFGHGGGYAVGLIFLPYIFELILGFGSAKYNKKAIAKK